MHCVRRYEHVVRLLAASETSTQHIIVMELAPHGDLYSLLARFAPFEESVAARFVRQIALALRYTHRRGIVHRLGDVKPENILVSADSEDWSRAMLKVLMWLKWFVNLYCGMNGCKRTLCDACHG